MDQTKMDSEEFGKETDMDTEEGNSKTAFPVPKPSAKTPECVDEIKESSVDAQDNEFPSEKLRFGIDSILNGDKSDGKLNISVSDDIDSESCGLSQNDGHQTLSEMENDESSDCEKEQSDVEENEAHISTAHLSMLGLSYSIYPPFLGQLNGSSLRQSASASAAPSSFPPSFYSSSSLPWSALQEMRKDRFGVVRRIGHPYQNRTPPKRKKPRTSFTRLQIMELEKRFERQKYLASSERSTLAKTLKMTDAQVKTWFQNRRTKWRRQTAEEREMERQAANRLLMSLQVETTHPKSMVISPDRMCLSQLQRWQENRQADT